MARNENSGQKLMIASIAGFGVSVLYVWKLSPSWAVAFAIVFAILFISSIVSLTKKENRRTK